MTTQSDDHYFVITSNSTIITSLCTAQVSGYTGMFIGCNSTKLKFRTRTSFIMTGNFWYNCKKREGASNKHFLCTTSNQFRFNF